LSKRDLLHIYSPPSTVLSFLSGFVEESELEVIEKDFRAKAYPVSMRGVKRFLFGHGRI